MEPCNVFNLSTTQYNLNMLVQSLYSLTVSLERATLATTQNSQDIPVKVQSLHPLTH